MIQHGDLTAWRECPGSDRWRLQVIAPEVAKHIRRDRRFRQVAATVTGPFLKIFSFAARDQCEADRIIRQYIERGKRTEAAHTGDEKVIRH